MTTLAVGGVESDKHAPLTDNFLIFRTNSWPRLRRLSHRCVRMVKNFAETARAAIFPWFQMARRRARSAGLAGGALDGLAHLDQFGAGQFHERAHARGLAQIGVGENP